MVTVRARSSALGICLVLLMVGCSREQQDWRSAERADTIEAYGRFIQRHPESELTRQARTRIEQLGEERDWQQAGSADTVEAYREFVQQHPNGRLAQEARIRVDNFSLNERARAAVRDGSPGGAAGDTSIGAASTSILGTASAAVPGSPVSSALGSVGSAPTAGSSQPGADAMSAGADTEPPIGPPLPASRAIQPPISQSPPLPATALTPTAPAAAPSEGFGIQLGAFASEAAATTQWQALATRFGPELQGLQEHLVTADTPSGHIYRLQASVSSEAQARVICESLHRQDQGCVAVLPH